MHLTIRDKFNHHDIIYLSWILKVDQGTKKNIPIANFREKSEGLSSSNQYYTLKQVAEQHTGNTYELWIIISSRHGIEQNRNFSHVYHRWYGTVFTYLKIRKFITMKKWNSCTVARALFARFKRGHSSQITGHDRNYKGLSNVYIMPLNFTSSLRGWRVILKLWLHKCKT